MIRTELYKNIMAALMDAGTAAYVDLWNQNVEFIEQEAAWPRPAVFVEFGPVSWAPYKEGLRGSGSVRLHTVTDWEGDSSSASAGLDAPLESFAVQERVIRAVEGVRCVNVSALRLCETLTNHNHEDIVESISVFAFRCGR